MTTNDIIVLNSILQQKKTQLASFLSESDFFTLFVFEQVLKNYDLTYDELSYGFTDGGDDGGIDGFFFFVNQELIGDETEYESIKKSPILELHLIQAKQSPSFSETAFDRVVATAIDIFDLSKDMNALKNIYNSDLIDKASLFRDSYLNLAARFPILKISFVYASKGDIDEIHPKVKHKAGVLKNKIVEYFTGSSVNIVFMGARELLDASRIEKSYTLQLQFLENLSRADNNYIILANLLDYFKFVSDEDGNLRNYIFEANVRDFQGDVEVNKDIRATLDSDDNIDFWWLNNGITILASRASIAGKTITLNDVRVVNGLQTTTIIYNYLKQKRQEEAKDRNRSILIRIIVIDDPEVIDRIIKATNFQTSIPIASLRATDKIQRDIEDYFYSHSWFYDRRKNFYKNMSKPVERIISISYLSQAIMAMILREPDNARARPSSLIKRDDDYSRVFSGTISPSVYLFCAKSMKVIDNYLRNESLELSKSTVIPPPDLRHLRFHLAMVVLIVLTGRKNYNLNNLSSLSDEDIQPQMIQKSLINIKNIIDNYYRDKNEHIPIEKITKSSDFVSFLLENVTLSS